MADAAVNTKTDPGCFKKFTSCRWMLAFMLCLLRMCQTALRQSIGMALVCMAERPHLEPGAGNGKSGSNDSSSAGSAILSTRLSESLEFTDGANDTDVLEVLRNWTEYKVVYHDDTVRENDTVSSLACQSDYREFTWDAAFEGIVLSSYYYGYLLTPLISSYVERIVGAKRVVAVCIGLGALVNLLTPELTRLDKYLLVALRVIAGTTNGMIDPAVQSLWAAWAPRPEVAYLTAVEYTGVTSMLWVIVWLALIYNLPEQHPRISSEELKYIQAETQFHHSNRNKKVNPPWLKMLCSPAVWAIIIASCSFMWVYSWVLSYLPMYMQDVLQYDIGENALLSSLPFVGKFASGLLCGYLADRLLRTRMSVACNRKMFQMIGCLGCAACTAVISFLDYRSRNLAVAMLILAVTSQNITSVGYRISALDIAPRYAGFILGLSNTIAVAVSLTGPLVTSAIVYDKTREQWQIMFFIVSGLSVLGGVAFLFLGRASLQDWARSVESQSGETDDTEEDKLSIKIRSPIYIPSAEETLSNQCPVDVHEDSDKNFLSDFGSEQDIEFGSSPARARRVENLLAAEAFHNLDATSQWSSCVSLAG